MFIATERKLEPSSLLEKLFLGVACVAAASITVFASIAVAQNGEGNKTKPFGATTVIIELTDNDIELQVFADAFDYRQVKLLDSKNRTIWSSSAKRRLKRQGGFSEIFWASEPTHYLREEDNFDGPISSFLKNFPAGKYKFVGKKINGDTLESVARLTHDLPGLPEITSPVSDTEDPPLVDPNNLVITWNPVTTQFQSDAPVVIREYQVIIDQVDGQRAKPEWVDGTWVDGHWRRALINLPGTETSVSVPPEFLLPDTLYDFEVLAIEASGNSTISEGEFMTTQ